MKFSEFNLLRKRLQKDIPIYEPEYVFLNKYNNVESMTTKEFTEALENSMEHIRKRRAMKPAMVFKLTQTVNQTNLPQHIKDDMIDQLHKYEDSKNGEIPDIELPLKPYPHITFTCKKTYSEAHNAFLIKVQEIQESNINILKKHIKTAQQDQLNVSIIKMMCDEMNKVFPKLGDELWELTMDFIGSLAFRTTQEAKLIVKKISLLLQKYKFPSKENKTHFIQTTIDMIKKCYSPPKRQNLANAINSLIKQSQKPSMNVDSNIRSKNIQIDTQSENVIRLKQYLLLSIPSRVTRRTHMNSINAVMKYIETHPNISKTKIMRWARDIKIGRFTVKELQ